MTDDVLVTVARWQLEVRRLRYRDFPASLFDEHAWDMLLQLFVAGAATQRLTLDELAGAIGGTPSVCARWLRHLVDERQIEEEGGALSLTAAATEQMRRYLSTVSPRLAQVSDQVRLRSLQG